MLASSTLAAPTPHPGSTNQRLPGLPSPARPLGTASCPRNPAVPSKLSCARRARSRRWDGASTPGCARTRRCGARSREGALRPCRCPSGWAFLSWLGREGYPRPSPCPCQDLSNVPVGLGLSLSHMSAHCSISLSLPTLFLRHLPSSAMSHSIYDLPVPMTWVIRVYVLIGVNTKIGGIAINSQALLRQILRRAVLSPAGLCTTAQGTRRSRQDRVPAASVPQPGAVP